jgi:hypothetical protein
MRVALIVVHAAAGVAAFGVGIVALRPARARDHRWLMPALVWLLAAMVVFVVGAIATHWNELEPGARITFVALVGLGGFMLARAVQAQRAIDRPATNAGRAHIHHIGFVLIALFDGFVVVTALDLGAPPAVVVAVALGAVAVGHHLVEREAQALR